MRNINRIGPVTTVAYTASSAANGTALPPGRYRLASSTASHVRASATPAPTAVVGDTLLAIGATIEHYVAPDGEGQYVAAIRDSADGTLFITRIYP
jgi:hypothetical protein